MHMLFTEQETKWIDVRKFGWPIRDGCPEHIRKSIERKKKILDEQKQPIENNKP